MSAAPSPQPSPARGEGEVEQPAPSDANEDTPTSFADGRYQVSEFLGEGGKKRVYLAHDTVLDRDVAFALIKMEGLDDVGRARVAREAQSMGRLGTHRNVVAVLDIGEHERQPWMVNELLGGGDVEQLIENADGGIDLERALQVAADVLRGLQFAHEQNVIHRDIKPANIWLTDDGTAKVGDFGLAIATDRSRLTQEKMMVGTVSYMPPEQATGGEITSRADLYSLGAMLYEMITGRPPFMGDSDVAVIGQHINTPPVAPQWHRPEIPAQLDSLVMRLLSKNLAERPESAADALSAIEAIDISAAPSPQPSPGGRGGQSATGSLDAMASGVFVGRQVEMDQLKARLENTLSGRGGMVMLVGEPGIGKTRTSLELETYAGLRNAQVLWGRCHEGGGGPPYWPWVQAIRSYVTSREPEELRREMGSTASVIADIVEDVKTSLPDLQPPTPLDDPESARFRLFDSIATFLKNAGQAKPLVLILDDLHWSDKPSLLLLEFVARELASSRILIVGTYRDMELNRRHPLTMTLGDLTRERLFERVLLRGLTHGDVGRFIELAAGVNPPANLVDAVHTQTEGNPLFVTETVRLFVQEGELTPENLASRDSWSIRTPEGVKEVIGRRLDKLSERTNEVLTSAAVIGRRFTLDELDAVSEDLTQDRLLDVIDEGLASRVIEELPEAVGLYQFSHAVIQQTLGDELSLTRRVRVHARIAVALEELYADSVRQHAETLAYHFEQAQTITGTEKLVTYSAIAGQTALDALGYDEALVHFRRAHQAREGDSVDEQLAEILHGLGRCEVSGSGDWESQRTGLGYLTQSFDYYRDQDDRKRATDVASVVFISTFTPEGIEFSRHALEYLDPDAPESVHVLSRWGLQLAGIREDITEAVEVTGRATEIARAAGLVDAEAWALYRKSMVLGLFGNDPEAIPVALKAVEIAAKAGDPRAELLAHNVLSNSYFYLGQRTIAVEHMDRALELAELSRDATRISQMRTLSHFAAMKRGDYSIVGDSESEIRRDVQHTIMAEVHLENNRLEDARRLIRESLQEFQPDSSGAFGSELRAAFLAERCGFREIWPEIDEVIATVPSKNPRARRARSLTSAFSSLAHGDTEQAFDLYPEIEPHSGMMTDVGPADVILGRLARLMDRHEDAISHFAIAIELCEKAPFPPDVAWAKYYYADLLIDRGDDADAAKIAELRDDAITIAQEIGMHLLLERVLAQREILEA